jgi:hypothetical protein
LSGNEAVQVGDLIVAQVDDPATNADYFALQGNFTDSNDILVGAAFVPVAGTISQNDSVHEALEKLQGNIDDIDLTTALSFAAGNGLTYDPAIDVINLGGNLSLQNTVIIGNGAGTDFTIAITDTNLSHAMQISQAHSRLTSQTATTIATVRATTDFSQLSFGATSPVAASLSEVTADVNGVKLGGDNYAGNYPAVGQTSNLSIDENGNIVIGGGTDLSTSVDNGLNFDAVSGTIQLGGALTENTNIQLDDFSFSISGSNVSGSQSNSIFSNSQTFIESVNSATGNSGTLRISDSVGVRLSYLGLTNAFSILEVIETGVKLRGDNYTPNYPATGQTTGLSIDENGNIVIGTASDGATKFAATITGDGVATTYGINHAKGTKDIVVQVYDIATDELVDIGVDRVDNDNINIIFGAAPAGTESFRVVIV